MMRRRSFRWAVASAAALTVLATIPATAQDDGFLNPMRSIDEAALKSFLERPLFNPSRRLPFVPPQQPVVVKAPVVAVEPPPVLHLLGVIHGKSDMAIVRSGSERKPTILRTGDRIGAWVLTVFPPVGVRLRNGERIVDYALFGQSTAGFAAVTAGPPRTSMHAAETSE